MPEVTTRGPGAEGGAARERSGSGCGEYFSADGRSSGILQV